MLFPLCRLARRSDLGFDRPDPARDEPTREYVDPQARPADRGAGGPRGIGEVGFRGARGRVHSSKAVPALGGTGREREKQNGTARGCRCVFRLGDNEGLLACLAYLAAPSDHTRWHLILGRTEVVSLPPYMMVISDWEN